MPAPNEDTAVNAFEITIPRERPFSAIAGFVVGGIASRHDLTLDALDDLQLALDSLLERDGHANDLEGDVNIRLLVTPAAIDTSIGPLGAQTVAEVNQDAGTALGLRRLLETLVDEVAVKQRDGGSWVELRKLCAIAEATG
jgi:hypothetical protein